MYETIYVPVDNSEYSNQAIRTAVSVGRGFGSRLIGSHVYAATMHDYRFKQMEFTLPEEYLQEEEIERQRKIHDSLITMGLQLISDCYLNTMETECQGAGLPFERKMMDGKHHVEIVKDIQEAGYDLVVLGALGVGKTRDSQIGSVCERVTRISEKDVLVIKHIPKDDEPLRDTILVGIDGSPQSFGALITAIELAKRFDKKIELIGVYDPYLHYAVFNSIVDVLTEKAAKVFRFEEQNQLHEEIIDTGLAQIYQSHLNVGEMMAREKGIEVTKTLLDGKAFQKVLNRCREIKPWLLVVGRIGVHSPKEERGLGSNSENLLRMCPCDILLSTTLEYPELDLKAEETILWTAEAEERMTRVPEMVRGVARTAILRLAIEQGHSVITNSVIQDAMDRFMPKDTAKATEKLAETLVLEQARRRKVSLCKKCGVTAMESDPKKCSVCGAIDFEVLTPEKIEQIIAEEGAVEEEITYDGRKLSWSKDARDLLHTIEDKYQKRRAKARIEKAARMKRLNAISREFAQAVVEDEVGKVLFDTTAEEGREKLQLHAHDPETDKKVIATDEKGVHLRSVFSWTDEAVARLFKVPDGFMRDKSQERVENLALERQAMVIDTAMVEEGIQRGVQFMAEYLEKQGFTVPNATTASVSANEANGEKSASKCPFSTLFASPEVAAETKRAVIEQLEAGKPNPVENGKENGNGNGTASHVYSGVPKPMNEVGVISELAKRREQLG